MTENLIIFNARVVTPIGFSARCGREMEEICIMDDATVEVTGGVITYVGPNRGEDRDGYYQRYWHYNARGKCLLPGFVDSHTHFVFGGERAEEFSWRLKGESYMSIMERGGGIVSTVAATRNSNFIQLRGKAEGFLKQMSVMGVTTVEGKSGYGLDKETELLQLRVMRSLNNDEHKRVDIVSTFLGAHAVPQEYVGRTDDYVDFIIREVMPALVAEPLVFTVQPQGCSCLKQRRVGCCGIAAHTGDGPGHHTAASPYAHANATAVPAESRNSVGFGRSQRYQFVA